ncbi:lasso RiPP family leader peptide-containing protein [Streptomyces sp. NBC_00341]|nr:lasso RiPP family leader peptide-containing protein [Streptomyces sp. NBC_00341]
MINALEFEAEDVYEAPLLAEVGDFANLTQGGGSFYPEGTGDYYSQLG